MKVMMRGARRPRPRMMRSSRRGGGPSGGTASSTRFTAHSEVSGNVSSHHRRQRRSDGDGIRQRRAILAHSRLLREYGPQLGRLRPHSASEPQMRRPGIEITTSMLAERRSAGSLRPIGGYEYGRLAAGACGLTRSRNNSAQGERDYRIVKNTCV